MRRSRGLQELFGQVEFGRGYKTRDPEAIREFLGEQQAEEQRAEFESEMGEFGRTMLQQQAKHRQALELAEAKRTAPTTEFSQPTEYVHRKTGEKATFVFDEEAGKFFRAEALPKREAKTQAWEKFRPQQPTAAKEPKIVNVVLNSGEQTIAREEGGKLYRLGPEGEDITEQVQFKGKKTQSIAAALVEALLEIDKMEAGE